MQNNDTVRGVVRDRRSAILLPSPDSGLYPEATLYGAANVALALAWLQERVSTGRFSFRRDEAELGPGHPRDALAGPVFPLLDLLARRWSELTIEFVGDDDVYFDCYNEIDDVHFGACLLLSEDEDVFMLASEFKAALAVPGKELL